MLLWRFISEDGFFKLPATRVLTDSKAETGTSGTGPSVLTVTGALVESKGETGTSGTRADTWLTVPLLGVACPWGFWPSVLPGPVGGQVSLLISS